MHYHGFRGEIYVGYRGELPDWSAAAKSDVSVNWPGSRTLQVEDGLLLHLLPLVTHYHFSNYKPDFMLRLWEGIAHNAESMFYFDPDIVVTSPWSVFEEWVECGVAMCEDVNSPVAKYHPTRIAWRQYFDKNGLTLLFKENVYANGGFVGVNKMNRGFLHCWQSLQEMMGPSIGGLERSFFLTASVSSPFAPFGLLDQDAMNASIEAWDGIVSFVNKTGMSFIPGGSLMSHAIGKQKPWLMKPLVQVLGAQPPRKADRDYWYHANGAILSQPKWLVRVRCLAIQISALIGRFYSRN